MKPLMPEHTLPVMEAFYTVQGEGAYAGSPAYFIRLGGCDVGCHWCDVKESWDADAHPKQSISSIVEEAIKSGGKIVVVTGGEPLMYNLDELTAQLKSAGLRTHIETSGAYPLSGQWDWICFSPKKFKAPVEEFYQMASELKVIVYHRSDLSWAEGHAQKLHEGCKLYLQPEWSREKAMVPLIVEYVKKNPRWSISLQTHKYMNVP
jgi:7-carboxy-7-deazaguanine synthase